MKFKLKILIFLSVFISTFLNADTITVSYDPDYLPYSAGKDKPYGLLIDIWKYWAEKNHHTIKFVAGKSWDDAIELTKDGKVDFFIGTTPYESWMRYSKTYYRTKTALFALKSYNPQKINSIGIVGQDYLDDIKAKYQSAKIVSYDDYSSLMQALLDQKVDAVYDDGSPLEYFATRNNIIHKIKKVAGVSTISDVNAISNNQDKIKLFDDGFKKLSPKRLKELEKNWIFDSEEIYYGNKKFYSQTVLTYVFDPAWKPFEYKDKMTQAHLGIIADILSAISNKTGIKFKPIPTNSWSESVNLVRSGKADMFSAVPYTDERATYLNLTKHNIYSYPAVLMSRVGLKQQSINDLTKKTIGYIKSNSLGEWVSKRYPQAHYKLFANTKDALQALIDGKIDLFAINGVTAKYYIDVLGYKNLKINTKLPYMFHLKIALRKSIDSDILSAIDDALGSISQKTLNDIYKKWTSNRVKRVINWKILGAIFAIFVGVIFIFWLINHKLKQLVSQKTKELSVLNENLEEKVAKRTEELRKINSKLQDNIKYASFIQSNILSKSSMFAKYFRDSFVFWKPKDTVGGDVYFFDSISDDKCLIYLIDCVGHGVSGAFVTMLTKALKEQAAALPIEHKSSPSYVLSYLNNQFKDLLDLKYSKLNVGFDAAVLYCDKSEGYMLYSGANIPIYIVENDQARIIKPDRYSAGYRKCDYKYQYTQNRIIATKGMQIYLTTDGFVDQIGGEKGFSFGKKRFMAMLERYAHYPMIIQRICFVNEIFEYQDDNEQTDDITMIGLKI